MKIVITLSFLLFCISIIFVICLTYYKKMYLNIQLGSPKLNRTKNGHVFEKTEDKDVNKENKYNSLFISFTTLFAIFFILYSISHFQPKCNYIIYSRN